MTQSHRPRRTTNPLALLVIGCVSAIMLILAPTPRAAARPVDPGREVADNTQLPVLSTARAEVLPFGVVAPAGRLWVWPLAGQPTVVHPFDPPLARWLTGHRGVDLSASVGDAVMAPVSGRVTFAGTIAGRGVVVVSTTAGLRATLEPVEPQVAVGDVVVRGQEIGTVGAQAGHCTPRTCVHWGVLRGDTYLDPLALLGLRPVVLLPLDGP